jgi:hypothetical protein
VTRCGGNINHFVSTTEEILYRFIVQYFPTQIQQPVSLKILADFQYKCLSFALVLGSGERIGKG